MIGGFWVLAACGGQPQGGSDSDQEQTEPVPYIYDDLGEDETPYDQAEVEATLDLALAEVLDWHADPAVAAYEAAMEGATEDCPNYYSDGGNEYWYDYCTSDKGASFSGYAFYYAYDDYSDGTYVYNGDEVYAEAVIDTPEGDAFEAGGYAYALLLDDGNGANIWYSALGGAFSWTGGGIEGTWMEAGVRAETALWISTYPAYGANYAYVSGGATNLGGDYDTVSFTDLTYGNAVGGWPCDGEPGGTMSVRAADGSWFDVVFDVDPDTWTIPDGTCDGCGEVWHRGEVVGEACVDPTPLVDWEGAPW